MAYSVVRARAPLRLGFAGGGTDVSPYCDVYGGAVINISIDLYAYTTIENLGNGECEFVATDQMLSQTVHTNSDCNLETELPLHLGCYREVCRLFSNKIPLSVRVSTYSDAPQG